MSILTHHGRLYIKGAFETRAKVRGATNLSDLNLGVGLGFISSK